MKNYEEKLIEVLGNLLEDIKSRQRKHDCPGFDCNVCTPDYVDAEKLLDEIANAKVK